MFCSGCGSEIHPSTRFCPKCGFAVTAASPAAYAAQPGTTGPVYGGVPHVMGPRYAGFWLRVAAYLIDGFILGVPFAVIVVCVFAFMGGAAALTAHLSQLQNPDQIAANLPGFISAIIGFYFVFFLGALVMSWLYSALMESSARQGTIGKIILNLYVTDLNGARISFGRASGRYFAKVGMGLVPFGSLGYILAGFTDRKQALEDFVASTLVYRKD